MKNTNPAKLTATTSNLNKINRIKIARSLPEKERNTSDKNLWPCLSIH